MNVCYKPKRKIFTYQSYTYVLRRQNEAYDAVAYLVSAQSLFAQRMWRGSRVSRVRPALDDDVPLLDDARAPVLEVCEDVVGVLFVIDAVLLR